MDVNVQEMPGYRESPVRLFFYVQRPASGSIRDIMDGMLVAAFRLHPKGVGAVIEERAVLVLPTGEELLGVSLKTEHFEVVIDGMGDYATQNNLLYGGVHRSAIHLSDDREIPLADYKCSKY